MAGLTKSVSPCLKRFLLRTDMEIAIKNAALLAGDFSNAEYIRGMCELLAMLYPCLGVDPYGRAEWFESRIREIAV